MVDNKTRQKQKKFKPNDIQDKRTQKQSFGVGDTSLLHDSKHASGASVLTNLT